MKKKLISLFLIVSLFSFIGVAQASDFDDGKQFTAQCVKYCKEKGGNLITHSGGIQYTTKEYKATSSESGKSYDAFCVDPAGQASSGPFTSHPVSNASFGAGLQAILSSNASYDAKRTALVTFIYGVARPAGIAGDLHLINSFANWNGGLDLTYASAFTNTGIDWACQNESLTSQLVNISGSCVSSLQSSYSGVTKYSPSYKLEGGTPVDGAYPLFVNALQAAVDAKNGGGNSEDSSGNVEATLNDPQINEDNVVITATFNISFVIQYV